MRPWEIVKELEATSSRLEKERILSEHLEDNLELQDGLRHCFDLMKVFYIRQVDKKEDDSGEGLGWGHFLSEVEQLLSRQVTGNDAKDLVEKLMGIATKDQWNNWYRRVILKDMRCGMSETTVNKVAKRLGLDYTIPVFECMLATDSAKVPAHMKDICRAPAKVISAELRQR